MDRKAWKQALKDLPDQTRLDQFLDDLENGEDIGYVGTPPKGARCRRNPPLEPAARAKFGLKVLKWLDKRHVLGPFPPNHPVITTNQHRLRINPVFTVWKPDSDVRPVINYSKKLDDDGPSLNERIKEGPKATVEYLQHKELIATIQLVLLIYGSCWLWAQDLDEGYYNCRVRPHQMWLLAFEFAGFVFIPMVLAMGLSSAPLIFTIFMGYVVMAMRLHDQSLTYMTVESRLVDRTLWQTDAGLVYSDDGKTVKVPLINYYLDDIFGMAPQHLIHAQFKLAKKVLGLLTLSAKAAKDRIPAIIQQFLGVEYDVPKRCCRVPEAKAQRYIKFADTILAQKSVTKQTLFSLTGKARHMASYCKVISAFARGVEIHGHCNRKGTPIDWHHHINICGALRADIRMLKSVMRFAITHDLPWTHIIRPAADTELNVYCDAAGVHGGIGGFLDKPQSQFFQNEWDHSTLAPHCDIMWKEMVALLVAIQCYYRQFQGRHIGFYSDNKPIIDMLIRGAAPLQRPDLQKLIRDIYTMCIWQHIEPWWAYIKGTENITADRLSRFLPKPFEHATSHGTPNSCSTTTATNSKSQLFLEAAIRDTHKFHIDSTYLSLTE